MAYFNMAATLITYSKM